MSTPQLYRQLFAQLGQWIVPKDQRHLKNCAEIVAAILESALLLRLKKWNIFYWSMGNGVKYKRKIRSDRALSNPIAPRLMSREEIRGVHAQGEEALIALVEGRLESLEQLGARVEVLEGKASKTSRSSQQTAVGGWVWKTHQELASPK